MSSYLKKVHEETRTRFWVNNPTLEECKMAINEGAFACTTNPAYCSKLFQTDPNYVSGIVKKVASENKGTNSIAEKVYHEIAKELMELFLPLYNKSEGKAGFVTVQEDPRREEDHKYILEASLRAKELAPNYMAKIPVTKNGLKVIESMVEHNVPICATEVFSLSQATEAYRLYKEASAKYGNKPPFFITHITGIMDQYFKDLVKKEGIDISSEVLNIAGTAICLKQYEYFNENNYEAKILGGGARGLNHFTNFVGGDLHITINWSTAVELNNLYSKVEPKIDVKIPENYIDELINKLPNFKRAYELNSMDVEEFEDYGPVMLFRTQFLNGYSRLIDSVYLAK